MPFLTEDIMSLAKAQKRKGLKMNENELATIVVDKCLKIHRTLGPGLLESVYEEVLFYEFDTISIPCNGSSSSKRRLLLI